MKENNKLSEMKIEQVNLSDIKPYENNPRVNDEAVNPVMESIRRYGFKQPLVIDKKKVIIVGHTRFQAAQKLELTTVPCIISDMSEEDAKSYRILDNKLNEKAQWDFEKLELELAALPDFNFETFEVDFGFMKAQANPSPRPLDENMGDNVKRVTCPECSHEFPI